MRVGIGFDMHAFDAARPLVLGGVTVPDAPGLAGHSDADVLSHAIADALLGAAAMGDLGDRFPATEQWEGVSSLEILGRVARDLEAGGWAIVNIDATVIAQTPRLAEHRNEMRTSIARALQIETSLVSVKATSTDRLGATGRSEGIGAMAVAAVERPGAGT